MKKENKEMIGTFCLGVGLSGMGLEIAGFYGWVAGIFITIGIIFLREENRK